MIFPRERNQNLKMDYEDSDASFGNDVISQNQALINLIDEQPNPFNPESEIITEGPFSYAQFLNSGSQPPLEKLVQDVTEAAPPATIAPALAPAVTTAPKTPAAPAKIDYTSALAKQILGQGITNKWSGEGFGSADANAADMAKILAGIGITDISQFGKFTKTGINETVTPDGKGGFVDQRGKPVDPKLVTSQNAGESEGGYYTEYVAPIGTQEVFGNKETKQEVPNTYSERQQGDFFGGTFTGKGNTGYGVKFDSQGSPIFYTQGASSNDVAQLIKDMGPVGQIMLAAATGGMSLPAQLATNAGIQLLAGGNLKDIAKGAALSYIGLDKNSILSSLGGAAGNFISGSSGITDLLGKTGADIASRSVQQFVGSGGKVDLGQALLGNVVGSGVNSVIGELPGLDSLSATDKNLTSKLIAAVATGTPIDKAIQNAFVGKASSEARSAVPKIALGFGPGDPDDFSAGLIPGYFQPGGEGYIPPDEEDPITVQQQPSDLDDFLKQLEQYKQAAVTPDDIQKIISGQNFATIDDIQNAMNTIDIPKGVSEQDVQSIVSQAFADNPNIKIDDVQSIVDKAVSQIPTGLTEEDLAQSLGTTKEDLLKELGITEEGMTQRIADLESKFGGNFENVESSLEKTREDLLDRFGLSEEETQQRIANLEETFGGKLTGVESGLSGQISKQGEQIEKQGEQFRTLFDQYRQLGMDEDAATRQTIDDLGTNVGSQFEKQNEQFQTLFDQYRQLGLDEDAATRQTIDDLGSTFGEQLSGLKTDVGSQFEKQGEQFETLLQQYRDLGLDEDAAMRQTIDDLGADVSGKFSGLESKLTETQTGVDELAQSLGTTREDLLDQLGVTEEEISQRIANLESEFGGNFEDIESSLGKTREELLDKFGVTEDEINQRIVDLETEFGGNFGDIESSLEKTREDLFSRFGLSEEETAQRIADLESEFGGQLTSGLGKQSAETKALFQNLLSQQQAQEKAAAAQNTALTKALSQVQSTGNFNTLMTLLGSQQQPAQQAPMQDPYAHIKLMEDLFGTEIDLTPAGENTTQRK